ncbi:helix-turn-helix domain-containing protein [Kingella kingae]|uniref:helix-turn-helix domain-containing protein n=1 Tax=Kingella kingae TaxID=504 RepID=UPI00254C994F|nr:helix-turn-helix transcriptional regulator [Kingella kingae]MDK4575435.1 helix-turn-helix transcriptional regulator [Kingella kingae]MDK4607528.1 helix-turn-helix transcriptional regulator [Kingella kingae]
MMNLQQIFTKRFKEARKAKKMTQEKLGLAIGLDEFVASTRINRYEKGNHQPDLNTLAWIAQILDIPPAYFFADDELVEIVLAHYRKQAV